jgi:cell division protein FtsZ
MRQGPIADLFRSTEERARDEEPAESAAAPVRSGGDATRAGEPAPVDEAAPEPPRRLEAVPTPSDDPQHAPLPYTPRAQDTASYLAIIRVVGVGGAGLNALSRMMDAGIEGVEFVALNTDVQQLAMSDAAVKIQLGQELTRGLGSGSDSEIGKRSAEAAIDKVRQALRGSDLVFVTAGEGGGTGTGAAPVVARVARELGALTVGIVTMPFRFEGSRRRQIADDGLERLQSEVDTMIAVPNDRLLEVLDRTVSMVDAFRVADDVLRQGVQGICDLITRPGLINLDFADVRAVMQQSGNALMGIGMATGPTRAADAAMRAIDSPLLGHPINGATGFILSIAGGPDLSLHEITEAADVVQAAASENANIIFGASVDPDLGDQVWVTVIATGFDEGPGGGRGLARRREASAPASERRGRPAPSFDVDDFDVPPFLRGE